MFSLKPCLIELNLFIIEFFFLPSTLREVGVVAKSLIYSISGTPFSFSFLVVVLR